MTGSARGGGRPAGFDPRICPRCFGHKILGKHGEDDGGCKERLDGHGAAKIVGITADGWSAGVRQGSVPAPDWPNVLCADGRTRNLWKRKTVERYLKKRPGRGNWGGAGRPTNAVRELMQRGYTRTHAEVVVETLRRSSAEGS